MTNLFPAIARTRSKPHQRGESLFEFYNQCARPGYDEFRSLVNQWIQALPENDQNEVVSRMSRGSDQQFQSSLVELTLHAFLRNQGKTVAVHPTISGSSKRPDFAVPDCSGGIAAFVEVTTTNAASTSTSRDNREAAIYNAINAIKLPKGSAFGYDVVSFGLSSPPLAPLVRDIERWVQISNAGAATSPIAKSFIAADWEIELTLFSGGSVQHDHAIGAAIGEVGWLSPHLDFRNALHAKSKRYGELGAPYLIVVADTKNQMFGARDTREAVTEAVLGEEVVRMSMDKGPIVSRKFDGFWRKIDKPRNAHVSGVMLLPDAGLWGLRSSQLQPVLAANPWATHPLPDFFKVVGHFKAEGNSWKFEEGENFADLIGLPDPWPPTKA